MTPEQQRISIAEACEWQDIKRYERNYWTGTRPRQFMEDDAQVSMELPDYPSDLNAMHEAEEVLDSTIKDGYSQRMFYASKLGDVALNDNGRGWEPLSNDDCFPMAHATAAQRAEAFLRALRLWEE